MNTNILFNLLRIPVFLVMFVILIRGNGNAFAKLQENKEWKLKCLRLKMSWEIMNLSLFNVLRFLNQHGHPRRVKAICEMTSRRAWQKQNPWKN